MALVWLAAAGCKPGPKGPKEPASPPTPAPVKAAAPESARKAAPVAAPDSAAQTEQSRRAAALSRQPGQQLQALVEGMLAARFDLQQGQYDARHWDGLLAAAAQLTIPRTVAEGPSGGSWAAISADGKLLAIAPSKGETSFVIEARSGAQRVTLPGSGRPLGFSADGSTVWTFEERSLRSWESRSGRPLLTLPCATHPIRAAALSADGKRLAVVSSSPKIEIWEPASGRRVGELAAPDPAQIVALSLSTDGKELAAASADGSIGVLSLPSGRVLQKVPGGASVRTVSLSRDGTKLCAAGSDGVVRIFDRRIGQIVKAFEGYKSPINTAQFTPGDHEILAASDDGAVRLWALEAGRAAPTPERHTGAIGAALFFDQGRKILTLGPEQQPQSWSPDHTLRVWDADTGRSLASEILVSLEMADKADVGSILALDPTSGLLVTERAFGSIGIWDGATLKQHHKIDFDVRGDRSEELLSRDARSLLILTEEPRKVLLYATRSARQIGSWSPPDPLTLHALSPDGKRLLASSPSGTPFAESAVIWDSASGRPLLSLKAAEGALSAGSFSPDGKRVFGIDSVGTAGLWDAGTGARLLSFTADVGSIEEVGFSANGQRILLRQEANRLRVYDAKTGRSIFSAPLEPIARAALSPDGQRLLTVKVDAKDASVWSLESAKVLLTLKGHHQPISAVAYSPDGQRILTAGADASSILWRASDGQPLVRFGHGVGQDELEPQQEKAAAPSHLVLTRLAVRDPITYAAFSADGSRILTVTEDAAIVWDAATYRWQHWHDNAGTYPIQSALFSADGARVLMATSHSDPHDGRSADIYRWDTRSGEPLPSIHTADWPLEHCSLTSHGKIIAALIPPMGDEIPSIALYEAGEGKLRRSIKLSDKLSGRSAQAGQILLSPDGARILTVDASSVEIWDTARGKRLLTLAEDKARYLHAAFSPDGTRVATAGDDGVARIYDAKTGAVLRRFAGHSKPLTAVQFSPDGKRLATAGKDATARLWEAETGQPLIVHELLYDPTSVGFSPDGARLIVAAHAAYVYSTRHADYYAFACRVLRAVKDVPNIAADRVREALSSCP